MTKELIKFHRKSLNYYTKQLIVSYFSRVELNKDKIEP